MSIIIHRVNFDTRNIFIEIDMAKKYQIYVVSLLIHYIANDNSFSKCKKRNSDKDQYIRVLKL